MKKADFPMVIRVGQTRATIYSTPSNGSDSLTVAWYEGAARKRKAFGDLDAAKLHAHAQVSSLSKGEAEVTRLSGAERLVYVRARETIAEFGLSLDSVAVEYRDAKRLMRGGSLLEAARYYAAQRLQDIPRKTVTEVFDEMLKAKREEGLSERYLNDLDSRVGRFARDFQVQLSVVTATSVREWLQAMNVSNRSRNNYRVAVQILVSFAKGRKYLHSDWNEMESVPLWKNKENGVEIFTPEEIAALLSLAEDNLVPFLAIGAFAGLRTAEIQRLDWSKVNLTTGYITVDASIAKTNSRRLVPIAANLKAWLTPHAKARGLVVELASVSSAIQRLVSVVNSGGKQNTSPRPASQRGEGDGFAWKHNAMRHSYCSYRLADIKNAAQVALEAGNSPKMIFQHYRELVTDVEAKRWFSIEPARPGKVTKMPQAQAA